MPVVLVAAIGAAFEDEGTTTNPPYPGTTADVLADSPAPSTPVDLPSEQTTSTTVATGTRDETRHRQLGWDVLDWALLAGGSAVRQRMVDQAPAAVDEVVAAYVTSGDRPEGAWHPDLAAWGLAPPGDYATTATAALHGEIAPRLAARGVVLG